MKRIVIIFFICCNFLNTETIFSQWVAQQLPFSPPVGISCVKFWNQNTGWMSTFNDTSAFISKILKTTNGGNNWFVIKENVFMREFNMIDSLTLYGIVQYPNADFSIYRTFDGGNTWDSVSYTNVYTYWSLFFLNKDTGYVGGTDSYFGKIFITYNGSVTLNQIYNSSGYPTIGQNLTFFKNKINGEYNGYCKADGYFFKTTNSGYNWATVDSTAHNVNKYYFLNKDTGWVANKNNFDLYYIQHTINGGLNWVHQTSSMFSNDRPLTPYFASYNKGWVGTDGYSIYATTNGGQVWGKQIAPIYRTGGIFILDSLTGWSYGLALCKTTNSGGPILSIGKDSTRNIIPNEYILKQNYPNPFNSQTTIEFSLTKKSSVGINIYDITGKSVYDMTANSLESGNYKVKLDFNTMYLSSGTYFYAFITADEKGRMTYKQVKKLLYLK